MEVILAEKPSVAREIAAFVGARTRHDGYLEGSGYQVTWAYGHLVELKEPHDYDPALKRWSLESLPFIPARFELKLVKDTRSRQQFDVIKRLFRSCRADHLCHRCRAGGRVDLPLHPGHDRLQRKAAQPVMAQLADPGSDSRGVWATAARQRLRPVVRRGPLPQRGRLDCGPKCHAKLHRALRSEGLLWSVGRVQTPVLAMIVGRDDEIRTFKPEPFWELMTRYRDVIFKYLPGRFSQESDAQSQLEHVQGHPFTVTKVDRKEERSQPPQLYDLTELQRDMNRRFGLSADATLKAAQALYEAKLITYPRTDSRYLGSDMKTQIPGVLRKLQPYRPQEIDRLNLDCAALHWPHHQ